ncbi:MAG: bacterioferritin [Pseudomonadota bacterium]
MVANKDERRQQVIDVLNRARSMEIMAISQYMNQHYALDDQDFGSLAGNIKRIAIDEMRHAEMFAERIKDLSGEPTIKPAGDVTRGQDVREVFPFDASLEDNTIEAYNKFLQICRDCGDSVSSKIFETIINEEQEHYLYFDDTGMHINTLGDYYLAKVAGTSSSIGETLSGFVAQK